MTLKRRLCAAFRAFRKVLVKMKSTTLSKDFTKGSIPRQLLFLSLPFMASNALQVLYSTIDMIIVGEFVGTAGLSAVAQSSSILNFATMVCLGFANGGQVLIAQAIGASKEDTAEIICSGMQNMQFVDYYRQYADEDSEESREEVVADETSETEKLFFTLERAEAVMAAFENLNYRERAMVSAHLGFCMECYSTCYYDNKDLNENGKPKRKSLPK